MRFIGALVFMTVVVSCAPAVVSYDNSTFPSQRTNSPDELITSAQSARAFVQVTRRVEPVAERKCQVLTQGVNCDFRVIVDDRKQQPANAYQTLDNTGRPIIAFTVALIDDARNADELAFVMSHEAAHHIAGHIARQRQNAEAGAVIFGSIAALTGGDDITVESAMRIGKQVGARSYSKEFELEADALGTIITSLAGYQPVVGAQFFNRIPDPGNRFLGSHPPNSKRIATVERTAAGL